MLKDVGGFEGLSDEQIGLLTNRAAVRTYSKGAIIVSEGDEGNSLFVIQSGSVKAFLSDENGREVVLSTQGPGEYFGDLALFDDEPRSASIMALEPCKVMIITKSQLRDAIKEDPDIGFSLLHGLAKRVRILTENVRTLALLDVFGRLVKTLYDLAEEKDGVLVIEQRLTQPVSGRLAVMQAASPVLIRVYSDRDQIASDTQELVHAEVTALPEERVDLSHPRAIIDRAQVLLLVGT